MRLQNLSITFSHHSLSPTTQPPPCSFLYFQRSCSSQTQKLLIPSYKLTSHVIVVVIHLKCIAERGLKIMCIFSYFFFSSLISLQSRAPPVFSPGFAPQDKCCSAPDIVPATNGRHSLYNGCRSDTLATYDGAHPTVIPRAAGLSQRHGHVWRKCYLSVQNIVPCSESSQVMRFPLLHCYFKTHTHTHFFSTHIHPIFPFFKKSVYILLKIIFWIELR